MYERKRRTENKTARDQPKNVIVVSSLRLTKHERFILHDFFLSLCRFESAELCTSLLIRWVYQRWFILCKTCFSVRKHRIEWIAEPRSITRTSPCLTLASDTTWVDVSAMSVTVKDAVAATADVDHIHHEVVPRVRQTGCGLLPHRSFVYLSSSEQYGSSE